MPGNCFLFKAAYPYFWVFHAQRSTVVVVPSLCRKCLSHFGQNPLGRRGNGKLLARVVIPRFQQNTKQNRRAARFAAKLNLFSHRGIAKQSGITEQVVITTTFPRSALLFGRPSVRQRRRL